MNQIENKSNKRKEKEWINRQTDNGKCTSEININGASLSISIGGVQTFSF